jgi:hypothetical protein
MYTYVSKCKNDKRKKKNIHNAVTLSNKERMKLNNEIKFPLKEHKNKNKFN